MRGKQNVRLVGMYNLVCYVCAIYNLFK